MHCAAEGVRPDALRPASVRLTIATPENICVNKPKACMRLHPQEGNGSAGPRVLCSGHPDSSRIGRGVKDTCIGLKALWHLTRYRAELASESRAYPSPGRCTIGDLEVFALHRSTVAEGAG